MLVFFYINLVQVGALGGVTSVGNGGAGQAQDAAAASAWDAMARATMA